MNAVTPGYFATLGIPLRMGRDFRDTDYRVAVPGEKVDESDQGYRVAIVSESFARRFLGSQPIGRHIGFGADPGTPTRIEVVGVVGDSVYTGVTEERSWQVYVPFLESTDDAMGWFYVRTTRRAGGDARRDAGGDARPRSGRAAAAAPDADHAGRTDRSPTSGSSPGCACCSARSPPRCRWSGSTA